jgi:hypothetical protein
VERDIVESSNIPNAEAISEQTTRRAELMRPNPFHPGRLGKKGVPRAYAVLRQVAREQGRREDKGSADSED